MVIMFEKAGNGFEKVWSGEVEGCEVSLGFNELRGLFSYTAKKNGVVLRDRHCADPMDAGLMDGPGVEWDGGTPLVPSASEIKFEGRFAPFHTPEEIVAGTWLSPADWPGYRKAMVVVDELAGRMERIARSYAGDREVDEAYMNFGLIDCSKRLNALYGGPDNWPNRAFESLFTATGYKELKLGKSFAFSDHYLLADPHEIPSQIFEQICMAAANGRQEQPSYRDAVVSLCRQSRLENGGNADSFTVLPFVKVGEFIDEIRKSDRINVDLYADFNGDKVPMAHLGKTAIILNDMDAERIRLSMDGAREKHSYYWSIREKATSSKLDFSSRTFELTELVAAIKSCADWSLFFNHRACLPDLGYDLDTDGPSDRVLLACGMSEWHSDDAQEWIAVSRSKSDRLYHIERIDAWESYEAAEFEITESSATKTYPSDLIDQIAADHNGFRETDGVPPFINARYAAQLEHLREVYPLRQKTQEITPGTAALKDGLAKLERRAEPKKTPSHNKRPGYFTY